MKTSLVYTFDEFNMDFPGYVRANRRRDPDWGDSITPVNEGCVAAHDFVEHIGGNPNGTLEDEIAAFGAISVTRLPAGMVGGLFRSGYEHLMYEVKGMIETYGTSTSTLLGGEQYHIQPRKRTANRDSICEWIAEEAAGKGTPLARHIEAWMQLGIRHVNARFGSAMEALNLYQDITHVFDAVTRNWHPYQFAIRIDGARVDSVILKEDEYG